jgi:hypothetical protein
MARERGTERATDPRGSTAGHPVGYVGGVIQGLWQFINRAATATNRLLGGAVTTFTRVTAASITALNDALFENQQAMRRFEAQQTNIRRALANHHKINLLDHAKIGIVFPPWMFPVIVGRLLGIRPSSDHKTKALISKAQKADDKEDMALIMRQIKALHQTVEAEAASGWRLGYPDRTDAIGKVVDYLANHDPAVKALVGRVATGVVDLAGAEDPIARIVLAKLISILIGRLGVDKLAGGMLGELLAPLLGNPHPRNLHDVIAAIGQDIGASQAEWAQFYANGGSQVEQAGTEWRNLTSPAADIAMVGFFALAATEPAIWAATLQDTIGTLATDTIDGVAGLLKGV